MERPSSIGFGAELGAADTRLLLVESPLLGLDLESSLLGIGARVERIDPFSIGLDRLRAAKSDGIRALVSVNHAPELALLSSLAGLRYVSWTIDPLPHRRWSLLGGTNPANSRLFVHRKRFVAPLRAMGYSHVEWMPLACAPRRFPPGAAVSRRGDTPLFVGSSLQDERRILTDSCAGWGITQALPVIDSMLLELAKACQWDRSFAGFQLDPTSLPGSLKKLLPEVDSSDLAQALDAGLTWHFRRELVRILAREGTEIRGDDGWREIATEHWTGPLRNGQEMTQAYAGAAVNLDVPRLHQREIATLRAFDVMGSGGLLACEAGTELDDVFRPGEHFLSWSDERGLLEILDAAKRQDPSLDRIALAGREAVVAGHSLDDRARRILAATV